MKRILALVLVVCLVAAPAFGGSLRWRIEHLEGEIARIQGQIEELRRMVLGTVDKNVELFMDGTLPGTGEVKVVKGTTQPIHNCDALAQDLGGGITATWSVVSGTGVTIAIDTSIVYEGAGSLKITAPNGVTAIVKCELSGGSLDISAQEYLKAKVKANQGLDQDYMYYGESAYTDNISPSMPSIPTGQWGEWSWDISDTGTYPDSGQDAVTVFAFKVSAPLGGDLTFWVDLFFADPGPSQVAFNDGDRVGYVNPPYVTSYTGTGVAHNESISRKGTIKRVDIVRTDSLYNTIMWMSGAPAGDSYNVSGGSRLTTAITAVGDGYITIGTDSNVNASGGNYLMTVFFED